MDAGSFRYPVTVYHQEQFTDERGSSETRLRKVRFTRAAILWQSGYMHREGQELLANNQFQFVFRHYVEIDYTTIIVWQEKKYKVISYHRDMQYNDILCVVEEVHP